VSQAVTAAPPTSAPSNAWFAVRASSAPPFNRDIWQAPLVPVALAVTAGIVADRYLGIPLVFSLLLAGLGLVAWAVTSRGPRPGLSLVYLALSAAGVGAAYHHWQRDVYAADDIGNFASDEARPTHLRGVIEEEPVIAWRPPQSPLQSIPAVEGADPTFAVLRVTHARQEREWRPVSGRAQLVVSGHLDKLHVGDEVEVVGRLVAPQGPANPGEADHAAKLRDQHIRARVLVRKTADGVTRLAEGWPRSFRGWLGVIRAWGQRTLRETLPEHSGVATALLLGEGSTMTAQDWEKYKRTGVVHVLAISGLHLVILAAFLWGVLRVAGVRRRHGAWFVALFVLGYALLTGGRPPAMRAAVMVCVVCGGMILRRPALAANALALAWLVVALINPTDLFTAGCQLSFLSVAVLHWGVGRWFERKRDPLEQLMEESRPAWLRWLRRLGGRIAMAYVVMLVMWLVLAPMVAWRYHLVSFPGLVIGPPVVLLTAVALICGFLLLLTAPWCWPLAMLLAWPTRWCLAATEFLVDHGDRMHLGHWYVGDVPEWWLCIFYVGLLAVLMLETLRPHWRWAATAGLASLCVALVGGAAGTAMPAAATPDELRCTFLAVGHGGCTVLELPDGRTLLYDAGALAGPDVTRRQIAPYLWNRGIRRIDELFLSHADLDHFNGLPALLERFAVGQVTWTPSFKDKKTPGVEEMLRVLEQYGLEPRVARAGDHFSAGAVEMEVLHPPAVGPEGNEKARSLVLLVRHADHSILLTGDLEGPGLERVLGLPRPAVDVLMAPHHGSRIANTPGLAEWANPRVVISCQGPPRWPARAPSPYQLRGVRVLGTWPHGAITVNSQARGLVVETFVTRERFTLDSEQN
jgi:competence protein ComEC